MNAPLPPANPASPDGQLEIGLEVPDIWWPCRTNLTHQTVEIQAETASAIVCTRAGLATTAPAFLAVHLKGAKVPPSVSLELIVKVAGKLEDLRTRKLSPRKPKNTGRKQEELF